MKASELIERLQEAIRLHGDMEVVGGPKESDIDEIQVTNPRNTLPKMRLRKIICEEPPPLQICDVCEMLTRERAFFQPFREYACPKCRDEMRSSAENFAMLESRLVHSAQDDIAKQKRDWLAVFKVSKQKAKP